MPSQAPGPSRPVTLGQAWVPGVDGCTRGPGPNGGEGGVTWVVSWGAVCSQAPRGQAVLARVGCPPVFPLPESLWGHSCPQARPCEPWLGTGLLPGGRPKAPGQAGAGVHGPPEVGTIPGPGARAGRPADPAMRLRPFLPPPPRPLTPGTPSRHAHLPFSTPIPPPSSLQALRQWEARTHPAPPMSLRPRAGRGRCLPSPWRRSGFTLRRRHGARSAAAGG